MDLAGLYSRSFPSLFFERTEPANPYADLLIIADSESGDQAALDLYRTVLDENSFVYEYWNASDRNGIDASVIGFGWSNIIVYGWGTNTVPVVAEEEDPGYGDFLDNGGNLLLADQDWFYGHGLPDVPTFTASDFAYDYFGFTGGTNDPCSGSPCVSTADTVFYGQNVTPMDSLFTEALGGIALQHYGIYGTTNWGDYFDLSGDATAIFVGATDGNIYGAVKETSTYKAVNLGFMVDAAVDTTAEGDITYDAFADFLVGAIEYFDVASPAKITDVDELVTTTDTGPFEISATIIDANGDAITATLWWTDDDWVTDNDVAMTADGDVFSAEIPQLTATETTSVYYYIEAMGPLLAQSLILSEKSLRLTLEHVFYRYLTILFAKETRDDEWHGHIEHQGKRKKLNVLRKEVVSQLAEENPDISSEKILIQSLVESYKIRINNKFISSYSTPQESL